MDNQRAYQMTAIILIVILLLTGCSGGSSKGAEGTSNQHTDANKPIKLEIMQSASVNFPEPDKNFVNKALLEKLNVDIKMTMEPIEYGSKLNTRVGAGDFPDIMFIDKNLVQKYSESGALLDFEPYLDQLSDYTTFIGGEEKLRKGVFGGKQYGLPRRERETINTYWIRKDWLDALQLPMPTTVDELFAVAKAFTENDPDQNNKKDTLGISGTSIATFDPIFGSFGLVPSGAHIIEDRKLIHSLYDDRMKEALKEAKKFIDAGVIDPEFVSNQGRAAEDKAFQGKFGIIYVGWSNIVKDDLVKVWKEANPEAEWVQLGALAGHSDAPVVSGKDMSGSVDFLAVPKSVEKDPNKLKKIIELLNYVSTEEGNQLVSYGLKDEHYKVDGDKIVITDKGKAENEFTWVYQFSGRDDLTYLIAKFSGQEDYIRYEIGLPRVNIADGFVTPPEGFNKADADRFIFEQFLEFIYGKKSIDEEYDNFLQELSSIYNYDLYREAAEQKFKELQLID